MEKKYSFENGAYRRLMTMEEAFEELEHYVVSVLAPKGFWVGPYAKSFGFSQTKHEKNTVVSTCVSLLLHRMPQIQIWIYQTSYTCSKLPRRFAKLVIPIGLCSWVYFTTWGKSCFCGAMERISVKMGCLRMANNGLLGATPL